ncbi:MAG: SusC/RagA family TonB-linked outer membrane protein, partial [Paludibacteraceae bacterium]|nr:SusC/RagA family TonB-linked outer membrane protein [Paludibacteraceae bacterium]
MKKVVLLMACMAMSVLGWASITVTGVVTAQEDGEPVIGASVLEVGTTNGTITDFDGRYTITVGDKATLEISYVGMKTKAFKVSGTKHDVVLSTDAIAVQEVVVTAMGVVQEKKRMNFAVQNINSENLTESHSANFVNALQGKVAGLNVTTGSGSPNAGSQIIIRGIASINTSQNNEPLFIMDGMPISGGGSAAADINPNDIESVTVLKGAAAAALYGQDAANGVIMITTKQGQVGKIQVKASGSWQWDTPTRVPELQSTYAPGSQGFYREKTSGGWGPMLNPGEQIYDNIGNFLKTGFYHKYDFSVNGGTDKFTAYASVNWSKADGVVPEDYKQKFGGLIKASFSPAKWVTMNVGINFTDTKSRSTSGVSSAYGWPITDDITNYQEKNGYPRFLYLNDSKKYNSPYSPLYSIYNDGGTARSMRNVINGSVTFKPVKNLQIVGRVSYDTSSSTSESYRVPRWDDSYVIDVVPKPAEDASAAEWAAYNAYLDYMANEYPYNTVLTSDDITNMSKYDLGSFSASSSRSQLFTAGANVSYKVELPKDSSIDLMAGTEMKMRQGFSMSNYGVDFIIPGTYSLSNTNPNEVYLADRTASHSGKRTFGYFGEIRGDYKGLASISVTGRWDWSSTINKNPYFYPSVTAGVTLSELIPGLNDTKK